MRHEMTALIELGPNIHSLPKKSKEKRDTAYNIEGTTVNYVMCEQGNKSWLSGYLDEVGI